MKPHPSDDANKQPALPVYRISLRETAVSGLLSYKGLNYELRQLGYKAMAWHPR